MEFNTIFFNNLFQDSTSLAEVAQELADVCKKKRGRPRKDDAKDVQGEGDTCLAKPETIQPTDQDGQTLKSTRRRSVRFLADKAETFDDKQLTEEDSKSSPLVEFGKQGAITTKKKVEKTDLNPLPEKVTEQSVAGSSYVQLDKTGEGSKRTTRRSQKRSGEEIVDVAEISEEESDCSEIPMPSRTRKLRSRDKAKEPEAVKSAAGFSLDAWLKGAKPRDEESKTNEKGTVPVVFAEDTQQYSPSKFRPQENTATSVEETPAKMDEALTGSAAPADTATRKLFEGVGQASDDPQSSSTHHGFVAPSSKFASPPSSTSSSRCDDPSPARSDCSTSEPMVKLFRLSQEEIDKYSPRKKREGLFAPGAEDGSAKAGKKKTGPRRSQTPPDSLPGSQQSQGFQSVLNKVMEVNIHKATDSELFDVNQNPEIQPVDDMAMSTDDSNATVIAKPAKSCTKENSMDSYSPGRNKSPRKRGRQGKQCVTSRDASQDSLSSQEKSPAVKPLAEALLMPTLDNTSVENQVHLDKSGTEQDKSECKAALVDKNANYATQKSQHGAAVKSRPGRRPRKKQMDGNLEVMSQKGPESESCMATPDHLHVQSHTGDQNVMEVEIVDMACSSTQNTHGKVQGCQMKKRSSSGKERDKGNVPDAELQEKDLDELLATDPGVSIQDGGLNVSHDSDDVPLTKLVQEVPASPGDDLPLSSLLSKQDSSKARGKQLLTKKEKFLKTSGVVLLDANQDAQSQDLFASTEMSVTLKSTGKKRRSLLTLAEREARRLTMDINKSLLSPRSEKRASQSFKGTQRRSARRSLPAHFSEDFEYLDSEDSKEDDEVLEKVKEQSAEKSDAETQETEVDAQKTDASEKIEPETEKVEIESKGMDRGKDDLPSEGDKESELNAEELADEPMQDGSPAELSVEPPSKAATETDSNAEVSPVKFSEGTSEDVSPAKDNRSSCRMDANGVVISDTLDREEEAQTDSSKQWTSLRKQDLPSTPTSSRKSMNVRTSVMSRAALIVQRAHMVLKKSSPPSSRRAPGLRPVAIRGGILKSPSSMDAEPAAPMDIAAKASPPSSSMFRPINLPKIYSPSASPSAGILRKRKLSGQTADGDTPSPPNKVGVQTSLCALVSYFQLLLYIAIHPFGLCFTCSTAGCRSVRQRV